MKTDTLCLKLIFFSIWIMFVIFTLEFYVADEKVDLQNPTMANNIGHIRDAGTPDKYNQFKNQSYLKLAEVVQTFVNGQSNKFTQDKISFEREYDNVLEHHKPSAERMKHLNSISSTEEFVKEMQSTILFMVNIILKDIHKVILLDLAQIENKGDPAITLGELEMLSNLDMEVMYYGCYYTPESALRQAAKAASASKDHVAVLSSGGGNFGIYESNDNKRIEMLKIFRDYKFVLLSQSVWFGGFHPSQKDRYNLRKVKDAFESHPDVTVLLRDQWSYDYCKEHFPTNKLYLVPDMAFGIEHQFASFVKLPLYDIVWIERNDQETPIGNDIFIPNQISYIKEDWSANWQSPVGANLVDWTYMMVQNAALYLSRGRVVVTDRLHGFILSTIADKPVIIIDNRIKKISHFVNTWCPGLKNYQWANSKQEALQKALILLQHI